MRRLFLILLLSTGPLLARKYTGPHPAKPDIPYLLHADNLVATEVAEARQETRKNEVSYVVDGASSPARTPLASPVFLLLADQLDPGKLQLYKMESKGGRREVLFSRKNKQIAQPIRLNVTHLDENLYRLEVDEILPNGEYSLTPEGSDQVFCFEIY